MPAKGFAKLFKSCYPSDTINGKRKKKFSDDYQLQLGGDDLILNGFPIYAVPQKAAGTLTRNHYQAKVEGKDFNLADTPNDILFTSDIIPGSSDENSRRILQKIALKNYEHNVAASTLRRNNEKTELEIDETNGYARIVKTPKSIRKNIPTDLPPSPLMGYMTNRETFPSPKYSEKKFSTEFDASLTKRLNLEGKKGQAARKAGNVEGIGDIKIDDGNICESVIKLHQITTTNQQMLLDAENSLNEQVSLLKCRDSPKVNREQNGGVVGARWRSAAFSGTNLKPLSALIPTELRENASKIPKLAHTPSIASKKDVIEEPMMTRSCFLPSPQPELAPTTNDSSSSQIKRNMSSSFQHIKEIKTPPTIKKNKLNKLNHHKSSDQVANDGKKLEIKGEQEKFVMSCCSPIESRRNISRNSSVYQIKVSQIDNAVKKNGLFNSNEKYCNSYSSSSSSLKTLNNKGDETPIKMAPSKVNVPSCINNCGSSEIVSKLLPSCVKKDDKKRQDGFVTDGNDNFPKNDEKVTLRTKKKIGIAGLEKVQDTTTNMAMIATVYPFKRNTNQADSNQVDIKKKGYESDDDYDRSHFKIEDVTDDPNYKSPDENENYEGSLVEYCKLDQNKNAFNPRNSVFEAVSMTQQTYPEHKPPETPRFRNTEPSEPIPSKSYRYSLTKQYPDHQKSQTDLLVRSFQKFNVSSMANILDVGVGEPCMNSATCRCHGFGPHKWRKVCVHCKCDRNDHEIGSSKYLTVYERLGISPSADMAEVIRSVRNDAPGTVGHGYAWVPPGLSRVKVEEYMSQLPNHFVPRINTTGEKHRERQLIMQLPRQDLSSAYCKHLKAPVERKVYEEFVNARNEVALDIGYVDSKLGKASECLKCNGIMEKGDLAVIAPKLGDHNTWHPACFTCKTCDQLLIDLTYCVREGSIYCERHYAELHKPRCSACDELIFAGEYTKAMNKDWHSDHFCCWQCDSALTGLRYVLRDEHPFCIKCYEEVFANQCDECNKAIGIDSKDLSYKDKHWHENCFLCSMCKISLVDKPFGSKNEQIFCSNCYDNAFATRCDGCSEIFRAGMKKMEYKGKQWHDNCFCCALCKVPIGTKSFIPKNEEVYCAGCYEDKFATRCSKCKKVITTGGVTYKNEPWHRECFCCTNCTTSLAGQRFTSKDDKPYCATCYGDIFAKRCNSCLQPITGIGGAKFISFEDRHWHNDCFSCAQCTTSLVGKGFITDSTDILCPECAKARLMAQHS